MRETLIILRIIFISFLLISISCRRPVEETKDEIESGIIEEPSDLTETAHQIADSVLNKLSLEEKIGECLMPAFYSTGDEYTLKVIRELIKENKIGGIVLMEGDIESVKKISEISREAKVPLFISIDAEWGLGMRLKNAPEFPRNGKIRTDIDENLLYDYGIEVGKECRNLGINMVLGPVVDINGDYGNMIGTRSYGDNPERVSSLGVAYAKGLESMKVVSVAKHFPGHGSSIGDSHYRVAKVNKSLSVLDSVDLHPFRQFVNSGLSGVMAGYISVPSLSPNGEPAAVSYEILTGLLRGEMEFKGLILTDAFTMNGAKGFSASDALSAGADIILSPERVEKVIDEIKKKIEIGEMDESIIDEHCYRIIFYKALFGLWDLSPKKEYSAEEIEENALRIRESLL